MPLDRDEPDKQGQAVGGLDGERTVDPGVQVPTQRRRLDTGERTITVEENSGVAFAEASDAAKKSPEDPDVAVDGRKV